MNNSRQKIFEYNFLYLVPLLTQLSLSDTFHMASLIWIFYYSLSLLEVMHFSLIYWSKYCLLIKFYINIYQCIGFWIYSAVLFISHLIFNVSMSIYYDYREYLFVFYNSHILTLIFAFSIHTLLFIVFFNN